MKTPEKKNCVIPYNPFHFEMKYFSLPIFSPSVFSVQEDKCDKKNNKVKPFRWSIDHLAALHPAEIDETYSHHQDTSHKLDEETEKQAQKAIRSFFLQNNIAPSPWGVSVKHVTFSPNIPSPRYYPGDYDASSMSINNGVSKEAVKDVWTQTHLAIPKDVDLENLLGQYLSFIGNQQEMNNESIASNNEEEEESLNGFSLRRKLFSPGRLKSNKEEIPEDECDIESNIFKTPERQSISSCSSLFSSSPIYLKNISISSIVSHSMKSPPVSPILSAERSSTKSPVSRRRYVELMANAECEMLGSPTLQKLKIKSILKSTIREENINCANANEQSEVIYSEEEQPQDQQQHCEILKSDSQFLVPEIRRTRALEDRTYSQDCSDKMQDGGYQTGSTVSLCSTLETDSGKRGNHFLLGTTQNTWENNQSAAMSLTESEAVDSSEERWGLKNQRVGEIRTNLANQNDFNSGKRRAIFDSAIFELSSGMDVDFDQRQNDALSQDSVMQISNASCNPGVFSMSQF